MKRKILSIFLTLAVITSLLSQIVTVSSAAKTTDKADVINSLNSLLVGVTYDSAQSTKVSDWSEEAIANAMYGKLLWSDPDELDLDFTTDDNSYAHYDLAEIEKLTQSTFGRSFPTDPWLGYIYAEGDDVLMRPAAGESRRIAVQDFTEQGNKIIAVATGINLYSAFSEFSGYFQVVAEKNPKSEYGYTLVSLKKIKANQKFNNLEATASSALKEKTINQPAQNVLDGDLKTAWVEGVDGLGKDEWIKLETDDGSEMQISAIEFSMGYHKSDALLTKNGWPNKILIEYDGGQQTAELFDYTDLVLLENPATTSWVKITILEAAKGTVFSDTCISEISFRGIDAVSYFKKFTKEDTKNEASAEPEVSQNSESSSQPAAGQPTDNSTLIILILLVVVVVLIFVVILLVFIHLKKRANNR